VRKSLVTSLGFNSICRVRLPRFVKDPADLPKFNTAVDACGTFSETKREVGLLRMLQAGVITTDYASLMVEILKDNSRPDAGAIYAAIDMPWAKLVSQIAQACGK
jgi:hypothetical protein